MNPCPVTVWDSIAPSPRPKAPTMHARPCGQPVVDGGLCAKHAADKVRLGGAS